MLPVEVVVMRALEKLVSKFQALQNALPQAQDMDVA